jgi:hypothetical protein
MTPVVTLSHVRAALHNEKARTATVSVWRYAMACGRAASSASSLLPTSAAAAASTR